MNDRLTKIWLRKADGGIHFHCQIGISPHRRVLNEQTQLMSESKPAFRRAVKWQTGSREEGKARSNVRNAVHLYAPTSLPVTHWQCPFLSTVLNISSKGSWEHGMVVMQGWGISTQWSSVKIWYCIITASRRGSQQVRRHARPQAAAWFRTQPLSWPRAHQQSIHTISNQH